MNGSSSPPAHAPEGRHVPGSPRYAAGLVRLSAGLSLSGGATGSLMRPRMAYEWPTARSLLSNAIVCQLLSLHFHSHQVQTIWSREAVLSRHTSTALSMAAAFASASAPGIFPSESEGGRHFHWVKKERKENGVAGYSPRNSIFSYFFGFLRPTFNLKAQILLLQLL